jgi:LysR family glycine cleavage system transcriptional activator
MMEAARAMAGQGVAILTPYFYRDALREGTLIQPFDLVCDIGNTWDLVYPEERRNAPKIRQFGQWLLRLMPDVEERQGEESGQRPVEDVADVS